MEMDELLGAVDFFDAYITTHYGSPNRRERILARTVKLSEEVGELCSEVLAYHNDQRQEKLVKSDASSLKDEFADVIITTFMLAKSMDIDIKDALDCKVKKINKRFGKDSTRS